MVVEWVVHIAATYAFFALMTMLVINYLDRCFLSSVV